MDLALCREYAVAGNLMGLRRDSGVFGDGFALNAKREMQGHPALFRSLVMESVLSKHAGCVNRMAWSECGSMLLSGSDDKTLCLWDVSHRTLRAQIQTKHEANIFGVRFMPATNCGMVCSGAMDWVVQVAHVERPLDSVVTFSDHQDRVKTVDVEPHNPNMLWSASEDGTVCQFDLRERTKPSGTNVLIDMNKQNGQHSLEIKSAVLNCANPAQILVAASDPTLRVFDRRKLSLDQPRSSRHQGRSQNDIDGLVWSAQPKTASGVAMSSRMLIRCMSPFPTYASFSADGLQCVANYSGDCVYRFDLREQTSAKHASQTTPMRVSSSRAQAGKMLAALRRCRRSIRAMESPRGAQKVKAIDELSVALLQFGGDAMLRAWRCLALINRKWIGDARAALADIQMAIKSLASSGDTYEGVLSPASDLMACSNIRVCGVLFRWVRVIALDLNVPSRLVQRRATRGNSSSQVRAKALATLAELAYQDVASLLVHDDLLSQIHPMWLSRVRNASVLHAEITNTAKQEFSSERNPHPQSQNQNQNQSQAQRHACLETRSNGESSSANDSDGMQEEEETEFELYSTEGEALHALVSSGLGDFTDVGYTCRYSGSSNVGTDIKEARFMGARDQLILAGSDDGCVYIWDARNGELLTAEEADEDVVNCCVPHPSHSMFAASGIDDDIKLLSPGAASLGDEAMHDIMYDRSSSNNDVSSQNGHNLFGAIPPEVLQGLFADAVLTNTRMYRGGEGPDAELEPPELDGDDEDGVGDEPTDQNRSGGGGGATGRRGNRRDRPPQCRVH